MLMVVHGGRSGVGSGSSSGGVDIGGGGRCGSDSGSARGGSRFIGQSFMPVTHP